MAKSLKQICQFVAYLGYIGHSNNRHSYCPTIVFYWRQISCGLMFWTCDTRPEEEESSRDAGILFPSVAIDGRIVSLARDIACSFEGRPKRSATCFKLRTLFHNRPETEK